MFRLSRQVRFAINSAPDHQLSAKPTNSYAGFPSFTGRGQYFQLDVTVAGQTDPTTHYLLNIKDMDKAVRQLVIPQLDHLIRTNTFGHGAAAMPAIFNTLASAFADRNRLDCIKLHLTPFLSLELRHEENPMVRLSQRFEFSASHRLHSPALSDQMNRSTFGKCNNPHGHGHNYEVQVTLKGTPDSNGLLVPIPDFERIVAESVIDRFDHKNLNLELEEFRQLIPSVENIAKVIHQILKPKFATTPGKLAAVTVWETPKTWCEYSE